MRTRKRDHLLDVLEQCASELARLHGRIAYLIENLRVEKGSDK